MMSRIYYGTGVQPATRGDVDMLALVNSLPPIAGHWYFVDPTSGSDGSSGESPDEMLASISSAYTRCVSGAGDGICLVSRGTGTSSQTTSYLTQELLWTKSGITVYGVCAPIHISPRSRIANKTITTTAAMTVAAGALTTLTRATGSFITDGWEAGMKLTLAGDQTTSHTVSSVAALSMVVATDMVASAAGITSATSYCANLITISGQNNSFYNVSFWNGGANVNELGGVTITGERNYFKNCHIMGSAGVASASAKSLYLNAGSECLFEGCTIGTDTVDRGNNACAEITLAGLANRNRFIDCEVLFRIDSGTAACAVRSVGTTSSSGAAFVNTVFNATFGAATPAALHIVTTNAADIVTMGCVAFNFTAWGAQIFVANAASAAAAGGLLATKA